MKLNTSQIEVPADDRLVEALSRVLHKENNVGVVIESGTYQGLGTTMVVIKAMERACVEVPLITMEPHKESYEIAKKNLKEYDFVNVLYAMSVFASDAMEFITKDEIYNDLDKYPKVLIDSLDPINYYRTEIFSYFNNNPLPPAEDILSKLIDQYKHETPLFVLDSCGGIGLMEFDLVVEEMGTLPYFLFLDDAQHIKHFRSVETIRKNPNVFSEIFFDGRVMIAGR
jgi:hypothetical protein